MLFCLVILSTLFTLGVEACLGLLLGCSSCCSGGGSYSYQQPYYPSYQQPYSYYRPQQYSYQTPRVYQQPQQAYVQPRVQPQYVNQVYYQRAAVPTYSQVPTGSYSRPVQNPYQNVVNPRPQVQVNVQPSSSFIPGSSHAPFVPPRAVGPTYVPNPQAILVESTTEKTTEELEESGSIYGENNTYGEEMTDEETLEEVQQTPAPVRQLVTNPPRVVTVPSIESSYAPDQPGEYTEEDVTSPPEEEEYLEEDMKGPVRTTSVSPYVPPISHETPSPYAPPVKEETSETTSYPTTDSPTENYPDEDEATYVLTVQPVIQTLAPVETPAPYVQREKPEETTAQPPVEEVEYIEEEEEVTTAAPVPPAMDGKQFEEETEDATPVDGGAGDGEESGGYGRRKSRRRSL